MRTASCPGMSSTRVDDVVSDAGRTEGRSRFHHDIAICSCSCKRAMGSYHSIGTDGALKVRPNGEAQPPADEYGVLDQYDEQHESGFQKRRDSAGRLERNVSRHCE